MIFKNIAVVSIKENSYRITFFSMNKYNPANSMKKSGMKGKKNGFQQIERGWYQKQILNSFNSPIFINDFNIDNILVPDKRLIW